MYELAWRDAKVWQRSGAADRAIPDGPPDKPIERVALLLWKEHCVECAEPDCYRVCPLYSERKDGRCSRFDYGIYPNGQVEGLFGFGADVRFRRWAKIEAHWPDQARMLPVPRLKRDVSVFSWGETVASGLATLLARVDPKRNVNRFFERLMRRYMLTTFRNTSADAPSPDALYIKYYLDADKDHRLQLEILCERPLFRTALPSKPGWNEHVIPYDQLPKGLPDTGLIRLWPDQDAEIRVVFTWLDLVTFGGHVDLGLADDSPTPAKKVKCVAWDLDETLWRGVIGDDGPENVSVNGDALDLIGRLDERGILQTIVSKNDYDVAWRKIEELGIQDYFLYPAINWGSKSASLGRIAQNLNINLDTFAIIDDSDFERGEIASRLPQVRRFSPEDINTILVRDEFDVPVTELSRRRRQTYLQEARRRSVAAEWGDDYEGFLKSCEMEMTIFTPTEDAAVKRCLELLQRSNQFNLSGQRYSAEDFDALLANPNYECFAVDVNDKFGEHGIVVFMATELNNGAPTLVDFVLSCRVAQKKVEDALIFWLSRRLQNAGENELQIRLKVTDRNGPLRQVFGNLPFERIVDNEKQQILHYQFPDVVPSPSIIRIIDNAPVIPEVRDAMLV